MAPVLPPDPDQVDDDRVAVTGTAPPSHEQIEKLLQKADILRRDLKGLIWIVAIATIILLGRSVL